MRNEAAMSCADVTLQRTQQEGSQLQIKQQSNERGNSNKEKVPPYKGTSHSPFINSGKLINSGGSCTADGDGIRRKHVLSEPTLGTQGHANGITKSATTSSTCCEAFGAGTHGKANGAHEQNAERTQRIYAPKHGFDNKFRSPSKVATELAANELQTRL